MHLADAFIQSDLQAIICYFFISMCFLGIEPTTFCAANTMLLNASSFWMFLKEVSFSPRLYLMDKKR